MNLNIMILALGLFGCQFKPPNNAPINLKTFTIGQVDLKLPDYYSIHYPKNKPNPSEVYILKGADVALVGHFGSVGVYHKPEQYLNDSTIKFMDTINGAQLIISTGEGDYPYDSEENSENLILIQFSELQQLDFSINNDDSKSRLILLHLSKNWGYPMSVEERDELIKAVRKSKVKKE